MKLRYSEAFYSVQGEGKFVGVPSVFLRTFGCNFRCQGFGLDRGWVRTKHNPEVADLIAKDVHKSDVAFEELPIIHTGCDTYASIYPEFKKFMMDKTVDEVVEHLLSLTPEGKWTMDNGQDVHLVITGGEPLLGWQKFWPDLFEHPRMEDLKNVTFETNATQELREDFRQYIESQDRILFTFSCSPKLSISSEPWDTAIIPSVVSRYYTTANSDLYLKFVVADDVDVDEVSQAVKEYKDAKVECPVYIMPLGGRSEEYGLNTGRVATLAMERGWRYSPRLHVDIFGNAWGT
jgi:7-carboxy-7-deazaguanine synthase